MGHPSLLGLGMRGILSNNIVAKYVKVAALQDKGATYVRWISLRSWGFSCKIRSWEVKLRNVLSDRLLAISMHVQWPFKMGSQPK